MSTSKNKYIYFLFVIFVLLFLKIDFRLQNDVLCCSDDSDYYMHTETLVEDFDFDYKNQLGLYENARFVSLNKKAPLAFPGMLFFASPFMYIGSLIDTLLGNFSIEVGVANFKILFYSLSPIFYLFCSIILLGKSLNHLEIKYKIFDLIILSLGTGISYYAFERYSMSHVYEMFCSSLLIYLSIKFYNHEKNSKYLLFFITFFIFLAFYVRWVNYYFFFIPLIIKSMFFSNSRYNFYKNKFFIFSFLVNMIIFLSISNGIYGLYTLNAADIYGLNLATSTIEKTITSSGYILMLLERIVIISFSQEFGIFWFQPIIFFSIFFSVYKFLISAKNYKLKYLFVALSFLQILFIAISWGGTGSSFGWRYLMSLTPLAVIFYYYSKNNIKYNFIHYLLITFSVFSIFSTIFFETTSQTQLSLTKTINSYGSNALYVQRNFLTGYVESIFTLEAYFKIFITSYLGLIIFKILISFVTLEKLVPILEKYGLPVENEKFQLLSENTEMLSSIYFLIVTITVFVSSYFFLKIISNRG